MYHKHLFLHALWLSAVCGLSTSCAQAQQAETAKPAKAPRRATKPASVPVGEKREWHVKAGAQSGDGSAAKPLGSIQSAVDKANGGDTILVQAGAYQEAVVVRNAYPEVAPLTIRAADGAQPVLTGMNPVGGWKPWRDGIYSTEIEGKSKDLFAGADRLQLASWPKINQKWISVSGLDTGTQSFKFTPLGTIPEFTKSTKIYSHSSARANYEFRAIKSVHIEGAAGTVSFGPEDFKEIQTGRVGRFVFFNSPHFITEPGEYAVEYLEGERTRLYYKPRSAEELAHMQSRLAKGGVQFVAGAANVRLGGFVITGLDGAAISARKAGGITVEDCVLYNNETGMAINMSKNVEIRRTLVAKNYWGIGFFDVDGATVEQCEVAFNDEDGVRVSGRVWDTKSGKLGATNIKFSQCYIHHHQYQGHPDNVQFFRGVGKVEIDRCLLMFGGQQIMAEQTQDVKLTNSVTLASINRSLNLFAYDTPDGKSWNLENNTIGFTRYNPAVFSGPNQRSWANLYFGFRQPPTMRGPVLEADYDWFSPANPKTTSMLVEKIAKFTSMADFGSKGQLQAHGGLGNPKLRNIPASMSIAYGIGGSSRDKLEISDDSGVGEFAVGDLIEINGDGVRRKVTAVKENSVSFAPALTAAPFRYSNVYNWKQNANFQIDIRPATDSPVLKAGPNGRAVGAELEVAAYQKGDFDGDGKRDLPVLPEELRNSLPEMPNRYVYPYAM